MKVRIIGAGPAGLYLGYLLKKWIGPEVEVKIVEQNKQDSTFGFGVVFSDKALEFLKKDDEETHDFIEPHMERWSDLAISLPDENITIDGFGFTSIGRLELLLLLQERAKSVGIVPEFDRRVEDLSEFDDCDLIVAADGANSLIRQVYKDEFGTTLEFHSNKFMWYGTTKPYNALTQTFRSNDDGAFNVHHYRFSPDRSTFLVETDDATYKNGGFENMGSDETVKYFEELFATELDGHPIVTNNSYWREFPKVSQSRWSYKNMVLVGDALHTAHFSIGSGTRLAMEDVIQLAKSVRDHPNNIQAALEDYEVQRKPIVDALVGAANTSLDWYTDFAERMKMDPFDFVYSYIKRSGRISDERARLMAPSFMREYDLRRKHK